MGKGIAISLLSLALGLAVGYLAGATGDEAPVRTDRTDVRKRPARAIPHETRTELAEVLREIPAPTWAPGDGRVTGRVRNEEGKPLAGVLIRATQHGEPGTRRFGDAAPARDSLEEAVRKAVESYHWRDQTTVDAITAEDGSYALEGLADRKYDLRAYLEGWQIYPATNEHWTVTPDAEVDWTATSIVVVPVDVRLPDGTSPEHASIGFERNGESRNADWSAKRPEILVPPGAYEFTATVRDGEAYKAEPVHATIDGDRPPHPLTFRLKHRPGLRGRIRFVQDLRFDDLRVYALRFSGDTPTDDQLVNRGRQEWVWKGSRYSFRMLDLPPGRYRVGAGAGCIFTATTVDVGDRLETVELVVDRIDPELYVVVRALGPDGEPVALKDVSTSYATENSSSSRGGVWARRDDGSYIVFHEHHQHGEGGTYGIELESSRYGKQHLSYERGQAREFEVRFREPATLRVDVRGAGGRVEVALQERRGGEWEDATDDVAPDADGRAVLGPVGAGEYELVLSVGTGRYQTRAVLRKPVSLSAGENAVRVAMPRLHELVVAGKEGEEFFLTQQESDNRFYESATCGEDGKARFEKLPAGKYMLQKVGELGPMDVTVPCGEVVFKPTEYNALRVTVTNADGALAEAGFRDGDLVIALDGKEFRDTRQMQLLFAASIAKDEVAMTVVRGGRRVEITVNMREMMTTAGADAGGNMEPAVR